MNKLKQIKRLDWYITKLSKRIKLYKIAIFILSVIILFLLSSCSSSQHTYKGCDGKKKFKSQMYLR